MYQYQFLPPPISSHYGPAKMRYIKRTLIASLLITRLRGLLTLLKSVKYISSLFQEQVSMPRKVRARIWISLFGGEHHHHHHHSHYHHHHHHCLPGYPCLEVMNTIIVLTIVLIIK